MEILGLSFLSDRTYGKYGSTAVTRSAEACFRESMVIRSSIIPSDTGGHDGWMTNTSEPRTFSSICTIMFSFENLMTLHAVNGRPRWAAISAASAGCAEPAIRRMSDISILPVGFRLLSTETRPSHKLRRRSKAMPQRTRRHTTLDDKTDAAES